MADNGLVPTQWSYPGGWTTTRPRTGIYVVTWDRSVDGGTVQVTAFNGAPTSCAVAEWFGRSITVQCYAPDGTPANSSFALSYLRAPPAP